LPFDVITSAQTNAETKAPSRIPGSKSCDPPQNPDGTSPRTSDRETARFQNAAKPKRMNHAKQRLTMSNPAGLPRPTLLLRGLKTAIEKNSGPQNLESFGALAGVPKSTVDRWINGIAVPTAEALICLFERLSSREREELLLQICREYPTISHSRLTHDRVAVSHLRTLLQRDNGLVLVHGASEEAVTFLATALGHSAQMHSATHRAVLGVDTHSPDWFVPISGVKYLENVVNPSVIRREFEAAWGQIRNQRVQLVLLNGLGQAVHNVLELGASISSSTLVVVAEANRSRTLLSHSDAYILKVAQGPGGEKSITVTVEFSGGGRSPTS
jgi:hypothetical protein